MNAALAKVENTLADEAGRTRQDPSASDSTESSALADEVSPNENTDRRLYRRSVAYFFFGFGYDKNAILTDEP